MFQIDYGKYLMGNAGYRLRVAADAPVKRFWAVTAYDPRSRSLLDSGGNSTMGSMRDPEQGYIDKSWVLNDFEPLSQARRWWPNTTT